MDLASLNFLSYHASTDLNNAYRLNAYEWSFKRTHCVINCDPILEKVVKGEKRKMRLLKFQTKKSLNIVQTG